MMAKAVRVVLFLCSSLVWGCGSDESDGGKSSTGGTGAGSGAGGGGGAGSGGGGGGGPSGGTGGAAATGGGGASGNAGTGGAPSSRPLEGFGATTEGGQNGTPCTVSSLEDSGAGTLRECASQSNRLITFSVAGDIALATTLKLSGLSNVTIDGSSAPPPGITITAAAAGVSNALFNVTDASHDIVIRHLRFRDSTDVDTGDTFRIYGGSYNVVVDHCSFRRGADGALDITQGVHDVTVQWSIIAETTKNQLISYDVKNVSLHHNLYVHGAERNPQLDTSTFIDVVNNVIYDWGGNYGTRIRDNSSANLVMNSYVAGPGSDVADAVLIDTATGAQVYSEGNVVPAASNATGNLATRLAAPPVTELPVGDAMNAVLAEAGAWPRDAEDAAYVDDVKKLR